MVISLNTLLISIFSRNILSSGVSDPVYLPESNRYDTVLCGCIIDVDFDGENEILIGTYGQVCSQDLWCRSLKQFLYNFFPAIKCFFCLNYGRSMAFIMKTEVIKAPCSSSEYPQM